MNRFWQGDLIEFPYQESGKSRRLDQFVFGRRVQFSRIIELTGESDLVFRVFGRFGEQIHSFRNLDSTSTPKWVMFLSQPKRQFRCFRCATDLDALELRPLCREFAPRGKQSRRSGRLGLGYPLVEIGDRAVAQQAASFAGGVANMQNDVGDSVVIELPNAGWQFQLPLADDA